MFKRFIGDRILQSKSPVIFINGARQVGKSTLAKDLFKKTHDYYTLDDLTLLSSIKANPQHFINNLHCPVIIDEIQRCPELLLAIKYAVDEKRAPQRFILTGSVNLLSIKGYMDSLAGRISHFTLWPLSQEEIIGTHSSWLESLTTHTKIDLSEKKLDLSMMQIGGYPISVLEESDPYRKEWLQSYMQQIIEKDVRDISNIEGLRELPNIAKLLSTRVGSLLNNSDISRSLQIPNMTLKRYMNLLEMTFLFAPLKPWYNNLGKRLTKSQKIYFIDTALAMTLSGGSYVDNPSLQGHLLENFVYLELLKQISYTFSGYTLFHYRTLSGQEIDFIIEKNNGELIAIEVKSHHMPQQKDVLRIKEFMDHNNVCLGIIFYQGDKVIPVEKNIYFVPIHALWS